MEEILSKSTNARRRGLAVVATTALVAGASFAGAGTAFAADLGLTAESQPNVTQGAANQPAGDLTFGFVNNFTTNATVEFQIPGVAGDANNCTTQAGIDAAIEYADVPSVTVTRDSATGTGRIPTFTTVLDSSSTACETAGIQDVVKVTLTQPSSPVPSTEQLNINVSSIDYNVGIDTPNGAVDVVATPSGIAGATADTDSNAVVIDKSFTFMPRLSAQPGTQGNALGTATFKETTKGAYFPEGCTAVELAVSDGNFTDGVTPTIQVPSGYTVYKKAGCATADAGTPETDGTDTYTFWVNAPAQASQPTNATVTVAGLKADVPNSVETIYVTPTVGSSEGTGMDALNVVQQDRTGGSDRYATAARLFGEGDYRDGDVVLSGGELFPDALSANYLASQLGTGTLLTRQATLSPAARQQIISNNINHVYITGETAAVSQEIEDELSQTRVGDRAFGAFIQVTRLGGADRYATNNKINTDEGGTSNVAVLAAGTAPYDSLAVGPVVYANNYPLVLTNGSNLNNGEETQLQNMNANTVVIVGGVAVVSQAVEDQLKTDGYNVIRLAGATRYATSATIATWATEGIDFNGDKNIAGIEAPAVKLQSDTTNVTNGLGFADALAAGPLAGSNGQPILLAQNATAVGAALEGYLGDKTVGWFEGDGQHVGMLHALGLTAATANSMIKDAAADIGPADLGYAQSLNPA